MISQSGQADNIVNEVIDDIVRHLRTVSDVQTCANLAEVAICSFRICSKLCVVVCEYESSSSSFVIKIQYIHIYLMLPVYYVVSDSSIAGLSS